MPNRVELKILRTTLVFSVTASIVLVFYIWRAPPLAVRHQAAERRDAAPRHNHVFAVESSRIIPTAVDIGAPDHDTSSNVLQRHEIWTSKARRRLYATTTPPRPAHTAIEGNPQKAWLRYDASQTKQVQVELPTTTASDVSSRHLCACAPYASNVTVLGRRLERCTPVSNSPLTSSGFTQDDVYITIKTTQSNHGTRLVPLLITWLQTVHPEQV